MPTPAELAAKNTESGHQKAVFAWAAMAAYKGFAWANSDAAYAKQVGVEIGAPPIKPVPELKWLHAIPNGGARDPATAARMKAEGARAGVADIFLPAARHGWHGLYIEMKKPKGGRVDDKQLEFGEHCKAQNYYWIVCTNWQDAVKVLQSYLS
jgi:hypothetical protein